MNTCGYLGHPQMGIIWTSLMLKYPVSFCLVGHMVIDVKCAQIDFWSPYMKRLNKYVLTVLHKHLDDKHNWKNVFSNDGLYLHFFQISMFTICIILPTFLKIWTYSSIYSNIWYTNKLLYVSLMHVITFK